MKIHTYRASDTETPVNSKAVAYIHLGKDGWLPVVFRAPTEDEARARAQTHWDEELAKAAAKIANREAMSERRRKPKADDAAEAEIEEAF